ncbi:hypothetical protein BJY00DRAFT_303689 [Aspergillus carlsbadensis]|nr:hypothetical protein BJY00DRAFT_303689 [Aspergillus carlsbadensis]
MGGETSEVEQLFRYTSGRWLWDEEQQLKDRYKSFNVSQLQSVATQALGAKACNSISKLAEGGFNKVFRLEMDDGRSILARIPNPKAGISITFTDCVEGAVPAQITSKALDTLKDHVAKTFTIGPTVERDFWKKERSTMDISRGPWSSPTDFALSIARREAEWIKRYAVPKAPDDILLVSDAQNNPQVHLDLLHRYLDVVPCLMDISPELSQPTLWHDDLHSSNIFIQDNRELLLSRPDNFDELNPDTQAQIKRKIFKSTLSQLYLLETERQTLYLLKLWQDLGTTGNCPYHFTEEELKNHLADADGWNEVQDFFDSIEDLVQRDGWTHHETFEQARKFFEELREVGLKRMKCKEREIFDKQTTWARSQK